MSLLSIFGLGQLQRQAPNLPPWGFGQLSGANNASQQALSSASNMLGAQQQAVSGAVPLSTFMENVPDDEATVPVNLKAPYTRSHVRVDHMQRCLYV